MDRLADRIEHLRRELYSLAHSRGLSDRAVLELSRRLDRLVLAWYRARSGSGDVRRALARRVS